MGEVASRGLGGSKVLDWDRDRRLSWIEVIGFPLILKGYTWIQGYIPVLILMNMSDGDESERVV